MIQMIPHRSQQRTKLRDLILNQITNREKQNYQEFLNHRKATTLSTFYHQSSPNISIKSFRAKQAKIDLSSPSFTKLIKEQFEKQLNHQQKQEKNLPDNHSNNSFNQNNLKEIVENQSLQKNETKQIPLKVQSKQILSKSLTHSPSIPFTHRLSFQQSVIVQNSIQQQPENTESSLAQHNNQTYQNNLSIFTSQNIQGKVLSSKSYGSSQNIKPFSIGNLNLSSTQNIQTSQGTNSNHQIQIKKSENISQKPKIQTNDDIIMDDDQI